MWELVSRTTIVIVNIGCMFYVCWEINEVSKANFICIGYIKFLGLGTYNITFGRISCVKVFLIDGNLLLITYKRTLEGKTIAGFIEQILIKK